MLRAELHLHTYHSPDSTLTPPQIVEACRRRQITCLAVTDHNRLAGAVEVARIAPFPVIKGEEIRTSRGEIIGLFLEEEVPRGLSPEETVRAIKAQGGLVYVPHPFDRLRRSRLAEDALRALVGQIDVLEAFNARTTLARDCDRARGFAEEHGLAMASASDAHTGYEIGRCYVELAEFATPAEFLANLRSASLVCRLAPRWIHVPTIWAKWRKKLRRRPAGGYGG